MDEDDDARHRREEAERRAKRKAAKQGSRGDSARAKRKEHAQRILSRQKGGSSSGQSPSASGSSGNKRHKGDKPPPPPPLPPGATPSQFQNLFTQRAQGFQIEFRFRNAPPRPPVGPCFVGHSLDGVLVERSRQYKAHNAVEVNYKWKLHSEPDLGVPLAPSAMDVKSYKPPKQTQEDDENNNGNNNNKSKKTATTSNGGINKLHPDDEALLNWKGSLGDTAADALKKRQDQLRAAARLALAEGKGRIPNVLLPANTEKLFTSPSQVSGATVSGKKSFSRVLDEGMQTWMKKTTYLSNDYTRKVHDFKSLANTKQKEAQDLEHRQQQMNLRRSAKAITKTFAQAAMAPVHPTKKTMKPKAVMSLLPNVQHWGFSYTHVVIDKATDSLDLKKNDLKKTFVANVETQNNRMICQMWAPPPGKGDDSDSESDEEKDDPEAAERDKNDLPNTVKYRPIQKYNLDVIPLKEEDQPYSNFCFWVDPANKVATYLPLSSRVQLATGRPVKRRTLRKVARRAHTTADMEEINERKAEVDADIAEKTGHTSKQQQRKAAAAAQRSDDGDDDGDDDDGDDDFGDSDDSDAKPAASSSSKKKKKGDDDDSDDDEEETFGAGKTNAADDDDDSDDDD